MSKPKLPRVIKNDPVTKAVRWLLDNQPVATTGNGTSLAGAPGETGPQGPQGPQGASGGGGGPVNLDGGVSSSVYTSDQVVDGGNA